MALEFERYRETIDFGWVLARAIDRVAEARARVHPRLPKAEYERRVAELRAAVISLYNLLPPSVRRDLPNPRGFEIKALDDWVAAAVEALDRAGLLIRKKRDRIGGEHVQVLRA